MPDASAEAKIRDIYNRLEQGADFADMAREYSDDPVSGSDGGNLGWVNRGQMVPAFEQAMLEANLVNCADPSARSLAGTSCRCRSAVRRTSVVT